MLNKNTLLKRRGSRTRAKIRATGKSLSPRLSVFRSNYHIYAQLIDDAQGITLTAASSLDKELKTRVQKGWNIAAAEMVGQVLAEKAQKLGVKKVVFDRGPYMYHGRIKALAMGARAGGLDF